MGQWVAAIMAVLAVGGQIANYILNLKIRAGQMESEARLLETVAGLYKRQDVCAVEMEALQGSRPTAAHSPRRQPQMG
jgi:hypothetical protein